MGSRKKRDLLFWKFRWNFMKLLRSKENSLEYRREYGNLKKKRRIENKKGRDYALMINPCAVF